MCLYLDICYDVCMVLNTRNFLLYLLCVGFLVIAITFTAINGKSRQSATVVLSETIPGIEVEYTAEAVVAPTLDRATKLSNMREKVLALGGSVISDPEDVSADIPEEVPLDTAVVETKDGMSLCFDYQEDIRVWNPGKVNFKVVEGARILYREIMVPVLIASTTELRLEQESLLQLPLRSQPLPIESCLRTDVVGIALDGSLIRNNEQSLYAIFGA